jgi:SET and MYND domain-containing protein
MYYLILLSDEFYDSFVVLQVVVNTFNILDEEMANIGSGIYLGASTVDHSCEPNAVATFRNTTIYIRTLQDIPDFSWSKVNNSFFLFLDRFIQI